MLPAPLFESDTIHITRDTVSEHVARSRPGNGITELHHRAYQQEGRLVAECRRQSRMKRREA